MENSQNSNCELLPTWLADYGLEIEKELTKTNSSKVYSAKLKVKGGEGADEEQKPQFSAVAVKVSLFPYSKFDMILHEEQILNTFDHENIVKAIDITSKRKNLNPEESHSSLKDPESAFLVTELCEKGDLHEYVISQGRLLEPQAKKYFKETLEAVKYLHHEGVAHRDIKLQNILIGLDDKIKLIDFGFAYQTISDDCPNNSEKCLIWSNKDIKGTQGYICPELLDAQVKIDKFYSSQSTDFESLMDHDKKEPQISVDLFKADVFSLGVILFEMVVGHPPFFNANAQDSWYRYFYLKKGTSRFWMTHPKAKELNSQGKLSENFKDLIQKLLTPYTKERLSLAEIESHPWFDENQE